MQLLSEYFDTSDSISLSADEMMLAWSCQLKNLLTETGMQSCVIVTPDVIGHAFLPQIEFHGRQLEQRLRHRLKWTTQKRPVGVRETAEEKQERLFQDLDDERRVTVHKLELLRNEVIRLCNPTRSLKRRRHGDSETSDSDSESKCSSDSIPWGKH